MIVALLALAAVILLAVLMRRRGDGSVRDAGRASRQLAQLAAQSMSFRRPSRRRCRKPKAVLAPASPRRDQNDRTSRSLTALAEKLAVIEQASHITPFLIGQPASEHSLEQAGAGSFGEVQLDVLFAMRCRSAYGFSTRLAPWGRLPASHAGAAGASLSTEISA